MRGMARGNPQKRGQTEAGSDGLSNTQLRATPVAISATALPLPTGAATAAKQPAVGTAGTAATDVLTVQGIASMTAIKVDGSAVTQPVSGTVTVTGVATETTLAALNTKTPALGQATMVNSSPVVIASNQSAVPVSGTVTANAGTGTFAVSGPLTDAQLRASVVPVSLTSTTVTGSVAVTGTFFQATQPVSIAALPALVAGSAIIGKVGIDQTTPGTTNAISCGYIGSTAVATGNGVVGAGVQRVAIASDNSPVSVVQPTLTKGTQGSTGLSVQDLKDAGRAIVNAATAIAGVTAVTTEALIALNVSRDGATTASVTTIAVTSGKRFRVTHVVVGLISTAAAVLSARFSLRMNPAGTVAANSPIIATLAVPSGAALAQAGGSLCLTVPDGIEFSGTMQIGISQVCSATTGTVWASIVGFEY